MNIEEILALDRQKKINILLAATTYKSAEDSCNSLYMGSMAHASLHRKLGMSYPSRLSYKDVLENKETKDESIDGAIRQLENFILYIIDHPVASCPCCGQVIQVKKI